MRKRTTTKQLLEAIENNSLRIVKTEVIYKSSNRIDVIDNNNLKESLEFLAESIFSDMIDWHYRKEGDSDREYIFDTGRSNGYSDIIVSVHLCVNDGVSGEDLETVLMMEESEDFAEKV